jgi:hypothetical protein
MKKNIYCCPECKSTINTADRDIGTTPMMIGCTTSGCNTLANSSFYRVDQEIEPELIFIKPKNEAEWNIVWQDAEKGILTMFPGKKESKVKKMLDRLKTAIREHVKNGGLVELPAEVVKSMF